MAVSVVGTASGADTSPATTTVTFSPAPTAGNLLIAAFGHATYNGQSMSAPGGWTALDPDATTYSGYAAFYRIAADATAAFDFTEAGGADVVGWVCIELTGQAASDYINNAAATARPQTDTATFTTNSSTPSVLGCFALAFCATDGGVEDGQSVTGVTSGWTEGVNGTSNFHGCTIATRNSATSDTTTGITCAFTCANSDYGVTALYLIAPAASSDLSAAVSELVHARSTF